MDKKTRNIIFVELRITLNKILNLLYKETFLNHMTNKTNDLQHDYVEHSGIVLSIKGKHLRVKIISSSACSSCQIKDKCMTSETKEKIIDIYESFPQGLSIGDEVKVCCSEKMGTQAVIISFGLPLLLIIAGVMLNHFGISELSSVGIAIVILALYYAILWLLKNKIAKKFNFWVKK